MGLYNCLVLLLGEHLNSDSEIIKILMQQIICVLSIMMQQ